MPEVFDAGALARQIVVRHRETGYVRFQLPPELCTEQAARRLESGLHGLPGVYRAALWRGAGKLTVRFDPHVCGLADVARRLRALLDSLHDLPAAAPAPQPAEAAPLAARLHAGGEQLRHGAQKAMARLQVGAAYLRGRLAQARHGNAVVPDRLKPVLANALSEKAVINFLNDVLAFYLIKVHWDLISQRWLKEPLKYRNAWLSIFYLMFLLVRYRKTGMKK